MKKRNIYESNDGMPLASHRCSCRCLGPLTFHTRAVGDEVRLSHGSCRAERSKDTFRNGLVFSSRPLKLKEKLRMRVEKNVCRWEGSLRVGFTNVSPSRRSLPLPCMAIPDLTNTSGHWAAAVPVFFCQAGSELEFWVSAGGSIYISVNNSTRLKLLEGVDLSQPLWAMIDIYGQAYSISLLGSEKQGLFCRRSCPAPEPLISPDCDSQLRLAPDVSGPDGDGDEDVTSDNSCVVCLVKKAKVTLPCGHRCLCSRCSTKVLQKFDSCPLCRHQISAPHGR